MECTNFLNFLFSTFQSCCFLHSNILALELIGRYKWNFSEVPLDKRLDFFESNWAFFAGFGM